jgi:hypothetical protein
MRVLARAVAVTVPIATSLSPAGATTSTVERHDFDTAHTWIGSTVNAKARTQRQQ